MGIREELEVVVVRADMAWLRESEVGMQVELGREEEHRQG